MQAQYLDDVINTPGVRTRLSMVEEKDDEAVTYENSKAGFGSRRIVKSVACLIYIQRYRHGGRTLITISTTKFYLRILIDHLDLEVNPQHDSCGLSICSAAKSTRILLHWSAAFYTHLQFSVTDISITSWYLVILSTFIKASRWLGSEQDNTLELEGSLRTSLVVWWFRGYFWQNTPESALLLLRRQNYFAGSYRQVNTWSGRILGQTVFNYKCRLLGWYFSIQ